MRRLKVILLILAISLITDYALAQPAESEVALERIVVTPVRYAQETQKISGSVSVITGQDIENSNAHTIPDVLRAQAGLVVRDYYGNGVKVAVDLRGFGETAASNALVLVDGRRINEIDLSGVDWTQIPIETVERIEIARGANSVLYGDNAVGGVINIITKTGAGKPHLEFESSAGSFDMNKQRFSVSGAEGRLDYFFNTSRHSTHGYRRNNYYQTNDYSSRLSYELTDDFSLTLSSGYHEADYGVPGALRESQLNIYSRRESLFTNDDAGDEDYYVLLGAKLKFSEDNIFELPVSFRRRYMDTYWGTGGWGVNRSRIDTIGVCPKLILNSKIFQRENTTTLGLDFYKIDSEMSDFSAAGIETGDSDVDKRSYGAYLQNEFALLENLIFNSGYRYQEARYDFDYNDLTGSYTDVDDVSKFQEQVFKTGLVYNYKQDCRVFANIAKSFRLPVTEEFMRYNFFEFPFGRYINNELLPQKGMHYEFGLAHKFSPRLEAGLTAFLAKIKNEIYLNPLTYNNENYGRTSRRGFELNFTWDAVDCLELSGNYTFTEAIFDKGVFDDKRIPAVPVNKASLGLNWRVARNWYLNGLLNYTGERYFISDQSNAFPKMEDYITVDIKISYKLADAVVFIGVNNIFNERYSEYGAISTVYNERGYYPSPERNFISGCSLKF
ncbi:TonB-dependent receptor [Candidatus Omnitrophota bacterium]